MKYTIQNMENKLSFLNKDQKKVSFNGYAFMDEYNHCIIIVYGEGKRDLISNALNKAQK